MSTGLVGTGGAYQDQAVYGLEQAADLEQRRNARTKANKTARVQTTAGLAGTGAGIGASVGGPWGALAGFAIGLVGGALM